MVTPEFLKPWMIFPLTGSEIVLSLARAKVGCSDFALASTMNLPMYPVPPMIKILVLSAIFKIFLGIFLKNNWNDNKKPRELGIHKFPKAAFTYISTGGVINLLKCPRLHIWGQKYLVNNRKFVQYFKVSFSITYKLGAYLWMWK